MSLSAREENAKTVAALIGVSDDEAADVLNISARVRHGTDRAAMLVAKHLVAMLSRTIVMVEEETADVLGVEIRLTGSSRTTAMSPVCVGVTREEMTCSCESTPTHAPSANVPEIALLVIACYTAGMVVRRGIGAAFPLARHDTISVPLASLLASYHGVLPDRTNLGRLYLAGAGAVGNGFVWALATLDVCGEIVIVDPKNVSPGNPGRCLWYTESDVGTAKARALAARAQSAFANVLLTHRTCRLDALEERSTGAWLERLVVAVDSRRVRRHLQNELPRDVFDSSTTGIEEVVVTFNSALRDGACMSCVYHEDAAEDAHEQHVAALLGVAVSAVKEHYISQMAAESIVRKHPQLTVTELRGTAYDTLFKTLCGTASLGVDEGRTVLAPFSFVSMLAGVYLALEVVARVKNGTVTEPFNYWRASPWTSPVFDLRAHRPSRPECRTCGNDTIRATVRHLWGSHGKGSG